jgi:hypothetical protein
MNGEDQARPLGSDCSPSLKLVLADGGLPAKPAIIATSAALAMPGCAGARPERRSNGGPRARWAQARPGPGPLEVVAAQPAGHVDHLADEVQTRLAIPWSAGTARACPRRRASPRPCGSPRCRWAPVPSGAAARPAGPAPCRCTRHHRALPVGFLGGPGVGQPGGHPGRQFVGQQLARAAAWRRPARRPGRPRARGRCGSPRRAPVAGDLQHRRADRPRWVNSRSSSKPCAPSCRRSRCAPAAPGRPVRRRAPIARAVEGQRHQAGRGSTPQAELLRQPEAEVGRADLRDGQAAGGDHHRCRLEPFRGRCRVRSDPSPVARRAFTPQGCQRSRRRPRIRRSSMSIRSLGRAVAEQLALVFFVECNAVRSAAAR